MPQSQQTGAASDAFGRETAPKIARAIRATMTRKGSNEATLDGKRVVIKCARRRTPSVGVSKLMLKNLDTVVGAFEQDDDTFDVISLPAKTCRKLMADTRSKGPSAGRVGIVRRDEFTNKGNRIATVRIQES